MWLFDYDPSLLFPPLPAPLLFLRPVNLYSLYSQSCPQIHGNPLASVPLVLGLTARTIPRGEEEGGEDGREEGREETILEVGWATMKVRCI